MERKQKGDYGEDKACKFLIRRGYRILERNFRYNRQEIDIIACDKDTIAFIEVRSRQEEGMVSPEESIGWRKQKNIVRTAQFYLKREKCHHLPCRFDVVTIRYCKNSSKIRKIELIRDAFWTQQ